MNLSPRRLALVPALAVALLAPALVQAEGLSFNVGVVSLYKSDGVDQDTRAPKSVRPALQGGVDYAFSNGFYVGNWNSTGEFGEANAEIDLYGGYAGDFGNGFSYDVGVIRYVYPNEASFNANEYYGSITYGIATVKYKHGFGNGYKAARLGVSIEQPLTETLTLNAGVGFRNKYSAGGAYDYSVGVTYDMGSDLSASATVAGAQTSKAGDAGKARLILGIAKGF